jgi:hypothetical protein
MKPTYAKSPFDKLSVPGRIGYDILFVPASLNSDDCPEGEFHNAPHDVPATATVRE